MGRTGRSVEALALVREWLDVARASDDIAGTAECLTQIAWFCLQLGHAEQGLDCAVAARALWVQCGDVGGEAHVLSIYAWLLVELGLVDEGFTQAGLAVDLAETQDDQPVLAFALNAKAITLMYCRQDQLTAPLLERSLELARASGDLSAEALYLTNLAYSQVSLAEAAEVSGDAESGRIWRDLAIQVNDLAIERAGACGDLWSMRTALCNGAEYYALVGDTERGMAYLDRWLTLKGRVGLREEIHYLYTRGELLTLRGRLQEALQVCERAAALAEQSSDAEHKAHTVRRLGDVHEALGNYKMALALQKKFHDAYQRQMGEVTRRRAQLLEMQLETRKLQARAAAFEEEAGHDPLTGLPNRRSFDAAFQQLQGGRFCLAIADLDHFKAINDEYSHIVGDAVLRGVAHVLKGLGQQMQAFRFGGEEFALLFPGLDISAATAVAEAVRIHLERTEWGDLAPGLHVTASIGVAISKGGPAAELLTVADRRLYRAKSMGRNRVVATDIVQEVGLRA